MSAREPVLERRLRRLQLVVGCLALGLAILGFFPGERVYEDSNNCFGYALASSFTMEHHQHGTCSEHYDKLVASRAAGGLGLLLGLAIALLPGLAAYRKPTRERAWIWFVATPFALVAAAFPVFAIGFHFDLFEHVEVLWPEHAVEVGAAVLVALVMFVLPIMLVVTRKPPQVPEARVVS